MLTDQRRPSADPSDSALVDSLFKLRTVTPSSHGQRTVIRAKWALCFLSNFVRGSFLSEGIGQGLARSSMAGDSSHSNAESALQTTAPGPKNQLHTFDIYFAGADDRMKRLDVCTQL